MKKILFYLLLFLSPAAFAQDSLTAVHLPADLTLHFISPQPIRYVDISSKQLSGDLAMDNVFRIRLKDSVKNFSRAVVTIAGEDFIAQYLVLPARTGSPLKIDILPQDMRPLDIDGIGLSSNQLKALSLRILTESRNKNMEKTKAYGLTAQLNHVYTSGGYIFLDIGWKNRTKLRYDIQDIRFALEDRKVTKASNVQSIAVGPVFVLEDHPSFGHSYRNIFVFKKFTFPGNKVFTVQLSEKQLSGRTITLQIAYSDILQADNLPN